MTNILSANQDRAEVRVLTDDRSDAFRRVLVGVDGTSAGRDAIALGRMLRSDDGRLILAHVVLAQGPIYRNFHSTPAGNSSREMLEREAASAGVSAEICGMFAASVGGGLHQLAEDLDADLLVVGSSRRGVIGRLLRGDDTQGSLNGAACAVAIAPLGYAERRKRIGTIGVAYDGGPESETALAAARRLAARWGSAVRALTVINPRGSAAVVARRWTRRINALKQAATNRLRALRGVEGRVRIGRPDEQLVVFGDEVDLLVSGCRGHGALRRMLSASTSAHLARSARCPVLVLPRRCVAQRVRARRRLSKAARRGARARRAVAF
jgi:nucleotide-binding universal stress UspA family protein